MGSETNNGRNAKRGGRAYRSRLEPFVDFIRAQRQQRRTWQEIAEQLHKECNCEITLQGLHQYYRRYVKRHARPHWEDEPVVSPHAHADVSATRPETNKPILAAMPFVRPFRRPNPNNMNLNDPTKI